MMKEFSPPEVLFWGGARMIQTEDSILKTTYRNRTSTVTVIYGHITDLVISVISVWY